MNLSIFFQNIVSIFRSGVKKVVSNIKSFFES